MSEVFHKSVYTSRSSGYKYRTLSTNTGERKHRDSKEETNFDRKFKELKQEITLRIESELDDTQRARESIREKFEKIDAKIDSMIELQSTVLALRTDLHAAENTLNNLITKVLMIESVTNSEVTTLRSPRNSSYRYNAPIYEDNEQFSSTVTHI